jgi:hypothetical protein
MARKVAFIGKVAPVYRSATVTELRDLPVLTIFWTVPVIATIFLLGTISEWKGNQADETRIFHPADRPGIGWAFGLC